MGDEKGLLDPEDRLLLLDALRPPAGYQFDRAVGTTFTLDLIALLITPVAFALFDVETPDGRIAANPMAILDSVSRFADRVTVFTQAGMIGVPPAYRGAFAFLESSVVPVRAPRSGGIFHPKVWVIRFVPRDEDRAPARDDVRLRFLCLSRNLTFDRSWDTVLRLDGRPTGAPTPLSSPLGDFVRALPTLATVAMADARRAPVDALADEVATAVWDPLPDRLTVERLIPIGHDGKRAWPFREKVGKRLAMAPFVEADFVERFLDRKRGDDRKRADFLVSRRETLDGLEAADLALASKSFFLSDDALGEPDEPEVEAPAIDGPAPAAVNPPPAAAELRGLHAKLFIDDRPYWSSIFTGSANATMKAFDANVEFLVELRGRNTAFSTYHFVPADDRKAVGFDRLLREYERSPEFVPPSPVEAESTRRLERLSIALGSLEFGAEVGPVRDGDRYPVRLVAHGELPALRDRPGETLAIRVRPMSSPKEWRHLERSADGLEAEWVLAFTELTAFFAIELVATRGAVEDRASFVVRAALAGEPSERMERLLATEINRPEDLRRLFLMLLGHAEPAFDDLSDLVTRDPVPREAEREGGVIGAEAMLEPLMRTLAHAPARLDRIGAIVTQLATTEKGRELFPEGWFDLWAAIEAARAARKGVR